MKRAMRYVVRWRYVYNGDLYGGRTLYDNLFAAILGYLRLWFNRYVIRVSLHRRY